MEELGTPKCMKCEIGQLVPLSDYGGQGAAVHYKAWVCINPGCGFNIKIRNGDIYLNEPITPGGMNVPRPRLLYDWPLDTSWPGVDCAPLTLF